MLRYIPFLNDSIYEICFISLSQPLNKRERETVTSPFDYSRATIDTLLAHTQTHTGGNNLGNPSARVCINFLLTTHVI